ncbi:MAG TPA: HAMP domain-containing sensor histidine kinase [Pyrinomonadaceae bacterium]|nr:HAMP domain-containing sensor histidine kinase [Pyrinomonadaceae bacterium]
MQGKRDKIGRSNGRSQPKTSARKEGGETQPKVAHLIDQLRERSVELEAANRELRRVSHYRSLFLARMSHELRTPLTSILGFSEILLEQEPLSDTQRRFCQKIQDSGFQLQASLNQLVDLSRLEAGQRELFLQEFSLRETLRDSCAAVARQAQKQQVTVEYDLASSANTVVSDQGKLRQIIYNFLAWAISRSRPDQRVRLWGEITERSRLLLRIEDDGEPLTNVARVFDLEDLSREANVNELGIIIARQLVKLLKGKVALRKRDSGGLEVTIEVPARPAKG